MLLVVVQGFTIGARTLAATGAVVLVVTAAVLSIYVSVAGVIRRAPNLDSNNAQ